jgi:hypothetical protein
MTDSKKWMDEHLIISLPDSLCPSDKEIMEKRIKEKIINKLKVSNQKKETFDE